MDSERLVLWVAFNIFVLGMLAVDLGIFHRKAHAVSIKEASVWSVVWISMALAFNVGIYFAWGQDKALEFLTGYIIEKSLSVDNLFVFLMIFQYFATPATYQHRVLFWGIVGALVLRAIFIAAGAALLENFHWMIYVFGAFLVVTGIKMLLQKDEKIEPERNPVVRLFQRLMPISKQYHDQRFFVRQNGKLHATLLMLVLIVVETTDVIFAVDSIPAIFAVTRDPFIVYTSNVFAILGLRALYFLLAGIMEMFIYLKTGLSFVLCFVGAKMIMVDFYKIPRGASLGVIGGILLLAVIASLFRQRKQQRMLAGVSGPGPIRERQTHGAAVPRPALATITIVMVGVLAALTLAKWASIAAGPTANEAISILRVVERDWADAKSLPHPHRRILSDARVALDEAWAHVDARRYQESITAAQRAGDFLGNLHKRK